jgi:hypothetical protein
VKFNFEVGQRETHRVEFSWEKLFGVAKIWVDGDLILKSRPLALGELAQAARLRTVSGTVGYLSGMTSGSARPALTAGWAFEVGQLEKHAVLIEKERPLLLAAIRPHTYRVVVDDEIVGEYVG